MNISTNKSTRSNAKRRADWRPGWLQAFDLGPIDVSVCIVNWNCRDLLRANLQSLLEQPQGVRFEVILVDNASTDGAAEMAAREFPEVTLIRNAENRGFSKANNQAARLAKGRYLLFLNNDTAVPAGALKRFVDLAERHPRSAMIGPKLIDAAGRPQISYRRSPDLAALLHKTLLFRTLGLLRRNYHGYRRDEFQASVRRPVEALMGAALFVCAERFRSAGQWDESFPFGVEDIDLSLRMRQLGDVVYEPSIEIRHLGRVSSRQNIGFATNNLAMGYVKLLRKAGVSNWRIGAYKAAVIADAPLQLAQKAVQFFWRRLCRKPSAQKSALAVRGVWSFLRDGLFDFYRA